MVMISHQLMKKKLSAYYKEDNPSVDEAKVDSILRKMVKFVVQLDEIQNHGRAKNVNSFEFNLRDIFRWCDLMMANQR